MVTWRVALRRSLRRRGAIERRCRRGPSETGRGRTSILFKWVVCRALTEVVLDDLAPPVTRSAAIRLVTPQSSVARGRNSTFLTAKPPRNPHSGFRSRGLLPWVGCESSGPLWSRGLPFESTSSTAREALVSPRSTLAASTMFFIAERLACAGAQRGLTQPPRSSEETVRAMFRHRKPS